MRKTTTLLASLAAVAVVTAGVAVAPGAHAAALVVSEQPRGSWRANGTVYAIATTSTTVYLGGDFTSMTSTSTGQTVARTRLAALDRASGQLLPSWDASASSTVRSLFASEEHGRLFVGGSFTSLNGTTHNRVGALSLADGSTDAGFKGNVNNKGVRDLLVKDGKLFIAGAFTRVGYKAKAGLAALDPGTGSLLQSWTADVGLNSFGELGSGIALTTSPADGSLVVGGDFTSINGQERQNIGAVSTTDGTVLPWGPTTACAACIVFDLDSDSDTIYAARGGPGGRGVAYSATTGSRRWSVFSDGDQQAVGVYGDTVFLGGHFGPAFNGTERNQIAAVNASTGNLQSFAPDLGIAYYPGVWDIDAGPDGLRIGGGFKTVNGAKFARYAEFPAA